MTLRRRLRALWLRHRHGTHPNVGPVTVPYIGTYLITQTIYYTDGRPPETHEQLTHLEAGDTIEPAGQKIHITQVSDVVEDPETAEDYWPQPVREPWD